MKKKIFFSMCASLLLLASCDYNEDNFPGFDELTDAKDVQNITLTLEDTEYKKIADMDANKELAKSKDPEGETYLSALEAMGKNKFFTEDAPAAWYMPAYISSQYPYLSDGSKVTINYNNFENLPEYLKDFNSVGTYELSTSDYKKVWGESLNAPFLSPSTVRQIPALLAEAVSNPADGAMQLVNYAYSETEPSTGGGGSDVALVYQQVSEMDAEGGKYIIVAPGKDGNMYPFGMINDGKESSYMYPKVTLPVTNSIITSDAGADWVITVAKTDKGYSMVNPIGKYLYQNATYNGFYIGDALPAEGGSWKFKSNSDGTVSIVNIDRNKTVKLNLFKESYSYGSYPASSFGIYLNETFLGSEGGFTAKNVTMGDPLTYIWQNTERYGWKASANVAGTNYPSESWLVSPEIDLDKAEAPSLSFDGALNHLYENNRADFVDIKISEDFDGNVATAHWQSLDVPTWASGSSWDFVSSGKIDLAAYKGKKVHIAFFYKSTGDCAPTFEVKNLILDEPNDGYYADVLLFKEIPENEVEARALGLASTRASSKNNTSGIYRYNAETQAWAPYSADAATIAVLQPSDYATIGSDYISKPAEVLPIYLQRNYPYAKKDDIVAVVYYADDKKAVSATEFVFDGAAWAQTTVSVPTSIVFLKGQGEWIEAKVYYSSSLLDGDDGGFTVQDIELDGLTAIWKIDKKFGWKGSGYSGGNKVTESWLVSPEISLKKAAAPVLKFDAAVNHLKSGEMSDYFNIMLSTDYDGDATTATWTTLEIEGMPKGDSWDFVSVTPYDLSAYKDQNIHIAFHYKSDAASAITAEIKNMSVQE